MAKKSQGSRNNTNAKVFERRIAKFWTEWTGVDFRRRKIEGHDRKTVVNDGTADVICVDQNKICRFVIECKNRKDFSFTATPLNHTAQFWDWLGQAAADCFLRTRHDSESKEYIPIVHFKPTPNHDYVGFYDTSIPSNMKIVDDIPGYQIIPGFDKDIKRRLVIDGEEIIFDVSVEDVKISTWKDFKRCVDQESVFF